MKLQDSIGGSEETLNPTGSWEIGMCSIPRTVSLCFSYPDEEPTRSRGSITISANNVCISGLNLKGSLVISSGVRGFRIMDSVISGTIKIENDVKDVTICGCDIESAGKSGISIMSETCVRITRTTISGCLVGVSISHDVFMQSDAGSQKPAVEPVCRISDCKFESNGTDIVVRMAVRSGESDSATTARLWPDLVLSLEEECESQHLKIDASISGRFESPLCFKVWPIPIKSMSVPRRGFKTNRRLCHLKAEGRALVITEDAYVDDVDSKEPERRKKRSSVPYGRAEVHYSKLLGIEPGSDTATVASAFRRLALKHHPDKQGDDYTFIALKKARDELMKIVVDR